MSKIDSAKQESTKQDSTIQEFTKQETTKQAESPSSQDVYVTPSIQLGDRKVKVIPIQAGLIEKSQKSK